MEDQNIFAEVPAALKRLAKYVVRGFYGVEHSLALDLLLHYCCMEEDDLIQLLKHEHKQLRGVLNTLKADKLVKLCMRAVKWPDGKSTRHTFYYINYKVLVNVVKHKLDHIHWKIEAEEVEERDPVTRASFKCPFSFNTYTDLDAKMLFDVFTETFRCTYCKTEVEEVVPALTKQHGQNLLAKFNQQMEPLFALPRETEDIVLPYDLLEPQPIEVPELSKRNKHNSPSDKKACSSVPEPCRRPAKRAIRSSSSDNMYTQKLVIDFQDSEPERKKRKESPKKQPIWMSQSTVEGATTATTNAGINASEEPEESRKETVPENEIIRTLLMHETTSLSSTDHTPALRSKLPESGSDTTTPANASHSGTAVTAGAGSNSGEEEEQEGLDPILMVAGLPYSYGQISAHPELVAFMTNDEKEAYLNLGQEIFQTVFE
ncbi:T2EA factor, partial [Alectura lathami]|nr:T2EA factor [Alectura lathami]